MILKGDNIYLRFLRKSDAKSCYEAICESRLELEPFTFLSQTTQSLEDERHFITGERLARKEGRSCVFGIFDNHSREYCGGAGLIRISGIARAWEVGYWVRTSRAGNGIATQAVALVLPFAFENLQVHKVVLRHTIDNPPSQRIAERFIFAFEGIQREEKPRGDGWVDMRCYSLLDSEYRQHRSQIKRWQHRRA